MYQTYVDHDTYEWQNSYAYSSIVGEFLHLQGSIISLPILRRESDGYKVHSSRQHTLALHKCIDYEPKPYPKLILVPLHC